jgi:hypothetical protein
LRDAQIRLLEDSSRAMEAIVACWNSGAVEESTRLVRQVIENWSSNNPHTLRLEIRQFVVVEVSYTGGTSKHEAIWTLNGLKQPLVAYLALIQYFWL